MMIMDGLEGLEGFHYGGTFHPDAARPAMTHPARFEQFARDAARRGRIMAGMAVRDREAALDIVQDSLLALVSRYADRPEAEWPALFHTVLYSRIMDWKRKQARRGRWMVWLRPDPEEPDHDPLQDVADSPEADPAVLLERADDFGRVQAALQELPLRQQQAFLLRAWEGHDTATTARIMECGENSVKTHYARALAALRQRLSEPGDAP